MLPLIFCYFKPFYALILITRTSASHLNLNSIHTLVLKLTINKAQKEDQEYVLPLVKMILKLQHILPTFPINHQLFFSMADPKETPQVLPMDLPLLVGYFSFPQGLLKDISSSSLLPIGAWWFIIVCFEMLVQICHGKENCDFYSTNSNINHKTNSAV